MTDDTLRRIKHIDNTHEIEEAIHRDLLNALFLLDQQAAQLEIFTGAVEQAIKATDVSQDLKSNVTNSRKALKKPNLMEKVIESEARYFRHVLQIAFVRGVGAGKHHEVRPENYADARDERNNIYDCATRTADYILSMYYSIDSQLTPQFAAPVTRVIFLDPSGTMVDRGFAKRAVVRRKAELALMNWLGADYKKHFAQPVLYDWENGYGHLTEAGKASLRAAIEAADVTRVAPEGNA